MNRNVVSALQTSTSVAPGLQKRHIGKGVAVSIEDPGRPPAFAAASKKAKITAIRENYLECLMYNERNETVSAQVMNVAKQRRFRTSVYNAATITYPNGDVITYTKDATNPQWKRQANNGTTTVDQVPIPMWYIGEIIRCSQSATSAVTEGDSYAINWEEDEPREWAVI